MKLSLKGIVAGLLVALISIGVVGWIFRDEIVFQIVTRAARSNDIASNRQVMWDSPADQGGSSGDIRPPNIVFILADDLGMNDLSTFGGGAADGHAPTPNIDALARSGALFTQAYAGSATCAPSRAMLMTGRYAARTGFEFTPTPKGMGRVVSMMQNRAPAVAPFLYDAAIDQTLPKIDEQGLPGKEITIAERLKEEGYRTLHIGKWHLGSGPEFGPNAQGFDESLMLESGLYADTSSPDVVSAPVPFDPIDRFLWAVMQPAVSYNGGPWFEPNGYVTDYFTDEAVKAIKANADRPFFLYLAHWGVHNPMQAAKADYDSLAGIEPHHARVYAAMIKALDRSVGEVMAALKEAGVAENTIIVFSSDNGAASYIGMPDANAPFRGWKATLFEGGIRTPLLLSWPGVIPAAARIDTPVIHADLFPTLVSAAGAALPADRPIDGLDLLPLAQGKVDRLTRDALYWRSGHYQAVRAGDWKLQISARPGKTYLFDLAADPGETTNLASARPDLVTHLRALLDAHAAGARPPLYPSAFEAPIRVDKDDSQPLSPGDVFVYWPN